MLTYNGPLGVDGFAGQTLTSDGQFSHGEEPLAISVAD